MKGFVFLLVFWIGMLSVQSKTDERLGLRGRERHINEVDKRGLFENKRRLQTSVVVTVNIDFDSFAPETGWSITSDASGAIIASEPFGTYEFGATRTSINVTLVATESYTFTIEDRYGDGLCCVEPGSYSVMQGSIELASGGGRFGFSESVSFSTLPGTLSNIFDTINDAGNLPTFVLAAFLTGLAAMLEDSGPFTVFAPSEGAFAQLPSGALNFLISSENLSVLSNIVRNHIVQGAFLSSDLADGDTYGTEGGDELLVASSAEGITVNGATVIVPNIMASNGVVHMIDKVLLPVGFVLPTFPTESPAAAPTDTPESAPVSTTVTVRIDFDAFPSETSWSITQTDTSDTIAERSFLFYEPLTQSTEEVVTVVGGESYTFTINDFFGDGMCCPTGSGGTYSVEHDGTGAILVSGGGDFGYSESTQFVP